MLQDHASCLRKGGLRQPGALVVGSELGALSVVGMCVCGVFCRLLGTLCAFVWYCSLACHGVDRVCALRPLSSRVDRCLPDRPIHEYDKKSLMNPPAVGAPPFLCCTPARNYTRKQSVKYLKEMPAAGVPLTLKHFKLALKACETATSRSLTGGGGSGGGSSSPSFASSSASAVLGGRPGGSAGSGSGTGGGRQGWEADVADAVAAVPVIFELIRETADLSPDDDCYSSAMRCA